MKKRGPFKVTSSKEVYKNNWIRVREDLVIRPSGERGIFGVVKAFIGVTTLALTDDNYVYLVKEYHYAQDETNLELPSGGVDFGETPHEAAKRELEEETGVTAKKWTKLGYIEPLTVVLNAPNYLFLAENLKEGEPSDKEKDLIEVVKLPFKKVLDMVLKGEITHSASVSTILKVARLKGF